MRRFTRADDQEVVGFCAAALAFGRVQSVLNSIEGLLQVMGPRPAAYVRRSSRRGTRARSIIWCTAGRAASISPRCVWLLRQMIDEHGSIEAIFRRRGSIPSHETVEQALESFSRARVCARSAGGLRRACPTPGVTYFFSRPSTGGACKRLNLFLRWMVRRDAVDLGVWRRVPPSQLVVPLDTHVIRVGRACG